MPSARQTTNPITDPDGRLAYELRQSGRTLSDIASELGYRSGPNCFNAIGRYARANSLPDPARRRSARAAARYARGAGLPFDPDAFTNAQAEAIAQEVGGAIISGRTFGVEIEFTRSVINGRRTPVETIRQALIAEGIAVHDTHESFFSHTVVPEWKICYDASTDREVVSPVLSGIEGLREVRKVMTVLRRFGKATARDGGHVHIYAGDLEPMTIYRITKFYADRQAAFNKLVPASRRNTRWAATYDPSTLNAVRRTA